AARAVGGAVADGGGRSAVAGRPGGGGRGGAVVPAPTPARAHREQSRPPRAAAALENEPDAAASRDLPYARVVAGLPAGRPAPRLRGCPAPKALLVDGFGVRPFGGVGPAPFSRRSRPATNGAARFSPATRASPSGGGPRRSPTASRTPAPSPTSGARATGCG